MKRNLKDIRELFDKYEDILSSKEHSEEELHAIELEFLTSCFYEYVIFPTLKESGAK